MFFEVYCVMEALLDRIQAAEARVALIEQFANDPVKRVQRDLLSKNVFAFNFYTVPSHYYDLTLEQRASLLQCRVPQLCKSIIFENTMCDHNSLDDPSDSKFYCVVIQYTSKTSDDFEVCGFNVCRQDKYTVPAQSHS